ncbi:MAG: TetR/AcrR family transcriptional regulator [Acidobacteria bacterium]|nr:TetR/AcrR family transcriptional regulator [Acidobacteriota bacterium]MCY3964034.1 TetR/AcrR family transcriptional regulator [Acidobacteriota bacterium]
MTALDTAALRDAAREPAAERDQDRRAEIYRNAARIFHRKGYHATSINDIAAAVGLTKAGLYYYIKGKQDLLFAIMSFAMDQLDEQVIEPARRVRDPQVRLETIVACHARLITQDSSALTILVNELEGLLPDDRTDIIGRQRDYVDFIADTLAALRDEGKVIGLDPTVGAFSLVGMVLWISRWYRADGRLEAEEVVAEVTRMAVAAVLNQSTGQTEDSKR